MFGGSRFKGLVQFGFPVDDVTSRAERSKLLENRLFGAEELSRLRIHVHQFERGVKDGHCHWDTTYEVGGIGRKDQLKGVVVQVFTVVESHDCS